MSVDSWGSSPWMPLLVAILLGLMGPVTTAPLALPCTQLITLCGCPTVQPVSNRIIGGYEATRGAWPWLVSLKLRGTHECGGAIINQRFVLTAAHCFRDHNNPDDWKVVVAEHDLNKLEPEQQELKIQKLIMHEEYDKVKIANDIALIELTEVLNFTSFIMPICVPTSDQGVTDGESCILAGWGSTRGTANPDVLNQAILPVIPDDKCSLPDWYGSLFLPNTTFCAGYETGGTDACIGDSGGSLVCKRGNQWYTQGVTSWGLLCAEAQWPGIYTDVSQYSDWIERKVIENSFCPTYVVG